MLYRVNSIFEYLNVPLSEREGADPFVKKAAQRAENITALEDYQALAAILLHTKPKQIFEIGTYLGVTSDFMLEVLPDCHVVSIAYINSFFGKKYNNSGLSKEGVGGLVGPEKRSRYHQMYGSSHDLVPGRLIKEFGRFDLVLIDGDHSREGVLLDTELAKQVIAHGGTICWHDANPKEKYLPVRLYLENELSLPALATEDTYIGGVACWNREIESRIRLSIQNR